MLNIFRKRIASNNWLFSGNYIDAKGLYLYRFNTLPCIAYISELDVNSAYKYLRELTKYEKVETLQHLSYNYDESKALFNVTLMILRDRKIIEVGPGYVALLYEADTYYWAREVLESLSAYRKQDEVPERARIGFGQSMN